MMSISIGWLDSTVLVLRDAVPLNRTFEIYGKEELPESKSAAERQFREQHARRITWAQLLHHRVVVVLGPRGAGKTTEFKSQAAALEKSGDYSFFIPLYRITDVEQLRLLFASFGERFERWRASNAHAYLFLDSVDESRLLGLGAFERALALFANEIAAAFARSSIFISSRFADWNLIRVREALDVYLVNPMRGLQGRDTRRMSPRATRLSNSHSVTPQVFRLQPLDPTDAKRLAAAYRVENADEFWQAVTEGGYRSLALHPLDLQWMAAQWVSARRLGSFTELIEAAIASRLTEPNEMYLDAGAATSPRDLREMAEELAAACSYSGRPFIELTASSQTAHAVGITEALSSRGRADCNRLLHSALFHEASFGQLQFCHHVLREYLAACWVRRQIEAGLAPTRAMRLFVDRPFDHAVLVGSRRAELSWLASMSAPICERVAHAFPELLFFEGDPSGWSPGARLQAFDSFLLKLKAGFRPQWGCDTSEVSRLARALPSSAWALRLREYREDRAVATQLLSLIEHGGIREAAAAVMQLYWHPRLDERIRYAVILALGSIATDEMREVIRADLVSGKITDVNQLDAALDVSGISRLTLHELVEVIERAGGNHCRAGQLQIALMGSLLPVASFDDALKLLTALLAVLASSDNEAFRTGDVHAVDESWILQALPICLQRVVQLISREAQVIPVAVIGAGLLAQRQRNRGWEGDAIDELRVRIGKIPALRKALTLAIAAEGPHALFRCLSDPRSLIAFDADLLEWLTERANEKTIPPAQRHQWYESTRDIAIYFARGVSRRKALEALMDTQDRSLRKADLQALRTGRAKALRQHRASQRRERASLARDERRHHEVRERLREQLSGQSATACDVDSLVEILSALAAVEVNVPAAKLDVEFVTRFLGPEIAAIFDKGHREAWRTIKICDPRDYEKSEQWKSVLGAASVNYAIRHGLSVHEMSDDEAIRAMQLCIWSPEPPPHWTAELAAARPHAVHEALGHWFEAELTMSIGEAARTTRFILQAEDSVRRDFLAHAAMRIQRDEVPSARVCLQLAQTLLDLSDPPLETVSALCMKELNRHVHAASTVDDALQYAEAALDQEVAKTLIEIRAGILSLGKSSFDAGWFSVLVRANFVGAMEWLEERLDGAHSEWVLEQSARCMAGVEWESGLSGTQQEIHRLMWLFKQLSPLVNASNATDAAPEGEDPIGPIVAAIPAALARLPGLCAHEALRELTNDPQLAMEHAAAAAEHRKTVSIERLLQFGDLHTRDARSEAELFEQVLARLEDIGESVEEGPFSERGLFPAGILEKQLQLWLAARFSETPQRRFAVPFQAHRETQLDLERRPDLEISSGAGRVRIEVKPLDEARSAYTAEVLADILENQLVRKYLRGNNCRHGILLLMRLDERTWRIPDGSDNGSFAELIAWLQSRADVLRVTMPDVDGLRVFGIDFVIPM